MKRNGVYSLRARVLLSIAVAFVPAYVVLLFFAREQTRLARMSADAHALELASSIAVEGDRLEDATNLLLRALAEIAEAGPTSPRCSTLANSYLVALPHYLAVGAVLEDGSVRCFAMPPDAPESPTTEAEARSAVQAELNPQGRVGEVAYGGVRVVGAGSVPVEVFRLELPPASGKRTVLVALLDVRWIPAFLRQIGSGVDRSLRVFDAAGREVLREHNPANPVVLHPADFSGALFLQPGDTARVLTVPVTEGPPRRFAAAPLRSGAASGAILLGVSEDPLLVAAERAYGWTVVVLGIVGGLVLGAGLIAGSVLVQRPMDRLLAATRRVASGDLETRIGPIADAGEIGQLSTAFDEMTAALAEERRRADEARHQAERASQSKSDFLAVMSHELKTPLASIISFAELLESGVGGSVSDEQREHLMRIMESGWHLSALVTEILAFSRLDAGRETVRAEPTNVSALVADTVSSIAPSAHRQSLAVAVSVPEHVVVIETDPSKLRQILLNLLSNAIKFTEAGNILVSLQETGTGIRITVEDSGPGIAPEHRLHVFEPFWQVEDPLTRRKGGAGLGLSIVDQLARLLGGHVELESELGVGSRFTVVLPTSPPHSAETVDRA